MARLRSIGRYSVEDQTVGKGNFAVVELATHTVTKTKVALKVIDKRKISKPYVKKNMTREARIMSQLRHPNIVRLYETITSPLLYCLVMEYVPGGDLLTLVRGQKGGRLKEGVARRFVRQLVSALHHMHEHGIVHRDLKMENIMMDKKRENVKIIDFGLSNQCGPDELFKTHCGSPEYAAPELYVAGRDYGPEVDIWSLGVNMFAMVTGKLPFTTPHSENRRQHLLLQIRKGLKGVHDKEMAHLTDDCKDLLHGCIEPVPEDRLPLLDIEGHAWITCEGQEPFSPYQAPPLDLDLRAEIIEEMALRLKVYPEKIQDVVQENKLDDVSAIFNILMEDALVKRGLLADDHTRPPTPQVPMESTRPNSGRRDGSRASSARPGSAFTEISDGVRTPTVVTMVRPSLKSPEKKSKKIVDFELDVLDSEQSSWAQRTGMQNGLPPRWTKISRPLGNATTANRVKARTSYRTGNPGTTLIPSEHEYIFEKTDLLHASTIHILVPTPSFESQPTSQAELDVVSPPNAPRSKSPVKVDAKIGRAPPGASATQKKYKPITKVRLSYFGSTQEKKERAKTEPKLAPKEKPKPIPSASADDENVDKVKEVNVVDLSTNFEAKRQTYHGYHVGETPITTKGETEPKCTLKEKPKPIPCADDGNVDKVKEVNVVDLSTNFEAKRQSYHGYRVGETPITTKGETSETVDSKRAESGKHKTKEVRVCVAHREFFEDGQKSSGRPAATPYSSPRKQNNHNEPNVALSAKRYPLLQESSEQATKSDDLTTQSEDASTPTPSPSKPRPPTSNSPLKKKERTMGDSASTASSSTVPSPRSLLHPSVASVHGKKEAAVIMSNFTVLRCSDNTGNTLTKVAKNRSPAKRNDHEKKKGEKDKKNVMAKSQDPTFCRRTTIQLTNPEVRGRKFTMFNGMPQRALQKRSIRRSPDHSSKQTANSEHRDGRSAEANGRFAEANSRIFRTEDTPSKFIQKFGANRVTPSNNMAKDGHRYCKVPTFGYAKDNVPGQPPSSPNNRMRSATPASKSTSPLRRVVDISEQAMNSLVNEAIREKKSNQDDSGGDIVKSVQRHFNERLKTQRRSPACDVYARFIPIQVCKETGKEKGMIRPSSCPAPRLNTPKETVFNLLETLPTSRPYPTPPPPSSPSGRPPANKTDSPTGTGRAATATGISGRNTMNVNRTTHEMAKGWDTAYRLERKISDTVKRATYVPNMRNEQRTRAWVEDMTTVYAPK